MPRAPLPCGAILLLYADAGACIDAPLRCRHRQALLLMLIIALLLRHAYLMLMLIMPHDYAYAEHAACADDYDIYADVFFDAA